MPSQERNKSRSDGQVEHVSQLTKMSTPIWLSFNAFKVVGLLMWLSSSIVVFLLVSSLGGRFPLKRTNLNNPRSQHLENKTSWKVFVQMQRLQADADDM